MKKVLMCVSAHFSIEYSINTWMDVNNQVDHETAMRQWEAVYDAYKTSGVTIELIDQKKGLPDMVFTANGGIVYGNTFIVSNHRYKERKGEELLFGKWFASRGYKIHHLRNHQSGEGDALFFQDVLYMGWGFRSDRESHQEVGKILGVETVSLKLINPYFYDFDTAFCPIGDKAILYYPEAFDDESKAILAELPHALPIDGSEANGFIGNSVYINRELFVEYLDAKLEEQLATIDVKPRVFDMSEFKKSGGGIKCITLYLDH